ncbi:MAG TPA: endonuclease NucS [Candidatus Acidoferrum sp.]|nr:endonuclease NucS [Candidatus Acidoferrum sp.]
MKIKPTMREAVDSLDGALRARKLVLLIGECRVDYDGRASSTLDWGERLTIIKQDGSVLVHRPTGYEPINWQPPKCLVRVMLLDTGSLMLIASRSQPRETVSIEYRSIEFTLTTDLRDVAQFFLHVTEEQMKQAILISPELVEKGLKPLEAEKNLGEAGFTDIYAEDANGRIVVVEIKRSAASKDAVLQLKRYLETLRGRVDKPLRGIIAAPDLRKSAQSTLEDANFEFVQLSPERCFAVLKTMKDMKLSQFMG